MAELKGKLNVDVAGAVTELQSMMKEFKLKRDLYRVVFRGKGLEFGGYRVFSPDDDAGDIDWKASARGQKLFVKQYQEERDLKIMFVIDVGSNMVFGSTEKIKCEFAAELATALANLMLDFGDLIGFILFGKEITHFIECRKGLKQFQLFVETLVDGKNYGGKTDLNQVLDFATDYLDGSISSVILISDFVNITKDTEKKLGLLSNRFETIVIRVRDPLDKTLPGIDAEVVLESSSTQEQILVNPRVAKRAYEKYVLKKEEIFKKIISRNDVDFLDLTTDESFAVPLAIFLKERVERKF